MSFLDLEAFRNTAFGDVLELLNLHHFASNFQPQQKAKSRDSTSLDNSVEEDEDHRIEMIDEVYDEKTGECDSALRFDPYDPFLVAWNGPDDPENPKNFGRGKKTVIIVLTFLFVSSTYMGASVYVPGQELIQSDFHIGHVAGTLPLSIYVLGYGVAPLILSPISEQPKVGRNIIYIVALLVYLLFQIASATVNNLGGLVVIRFIAGVACSPFLSVTAATLTDIVEQHNAPYLLGTWGMSSVCGPVLGPLIGGALTRATHGWRFAFWFMAMLSGALFIVGFFFYRETSPQNILYRRAVRVNRETGDGKYYSIEAKKAEAVEIKAYLFELLLRPIIITIKEPGVLAFNLYIAISYGAYYLFFEAFPLVFNGIYNFTIVESGLAFMGFLVGFALGYVILHLFLRYYIARKQSIAPEAMLPLAMITGWTIPFALFLFGWGARLHWIVPIIIEIPFSIGMFALFQSVSAYLGMSYPRYVASVFASNSLARGTLACALPLVGQIMYKHTGSKEYPVGWGSSIVAFLMAAMVPVPFIFYRYGEKFRGRSKYAN